MSVDTRNMLLGPGELYFKRSTDGKSKYRHVGTIKGNSTLVTTITTVEQKAGNRLTVGRRDKTAETASLSCEVVEFQIPKLIAALGLSISTTQLTQTMTMRYFGEIVLGSTTNTVTLSHRPVSATNPVITSADRQTLRVKATDYSVPISTAAAGIKPILSTTANRSHFISYDWANTTARRITIGDKIKLQEVSVMLAHKDEDGKMVNFYMPKATVVGGLTLALNETSYTTYTIKFDALGDYTATAGKSLFYFMREA